MKKVTKAVILAGGYGTRMLPAARAVPKEMFPVVDIPVIHFLVEEAAASGITDILIITNRGKGAMEDWFDYSPEYEARLAGKGDAVEQMRRMCEIANISFMRQKAMRGTGHAVLIAKSFVGSDDFVMIYGDDMIVSQTPACLQLINARARGEGCMAAAVQDVGRNRIHMYGSLKVSPAGTAPNEYAVHDMIEKPAPGTEPSTFAILGRLLLTPDIFPYLEDQAPGQGGEIQLTDAMRRFTLANPGKVVAVDFEGERFDIGSKFGYMKACVKRAASHPEIAEEFKSFIRAFAATL